jgi:hypothetical protein
MQRSRHPIVLVVLCACAQGDIGTDVTVTDSAGVEIVESARPAWGGTPAWVVADTPSLSIGAVDGPADYQFTQIVGATRFGDGAIAVADAGTNSIRFFSADGRLTTTVGRAGSGPGEYRAMQSMRRTGPDTLDILDRRLERLTVLDRSGAVARVVQFKARAIAVYRLPGGQWLSAAEEGTFGGTLREDATPGVHRFPSTVVVLDSTGAIVDTAGVFPGAEMAYLNFNGQPGSVHAAFGRMLSFASGGDRWFAVTGDHRGFDAYAPDGRHLRSARAATPALPVEPADVARFHDALRRNIADTAARENFGRFLQAAPVPKQKAFASRILLDPSGHAWVSEYENELLPATE